MSDARAREHLNAELASIGAYQSIEIIGRDETVLLSSCTTLRAITAAIQQEREECAMVADKHQFWGGRAIAAAIRARNEHKDDR